MWDYYSGGKVLRREGQNISMDKGREEDRNHDHFCETAEVLPSCFPSGCTPVCVCHASVGLSKPGENYIIILTTSYTACVR